MTSTPPPQTTPRTLLRSRTHRVIVGVAGGVGEYFNVDPVIVRLVLVLLTVVGGLGALLYLTAWLIVPEAAADPNQPEPDRTATHAWLAVGALSLIVIMGGIGGIGSGFGVNGRLVWPLALIVIGGAVLWIRSNRPPVALTQLPVPAGTSERTSTAFVVAPPLDSPPAPTTSTPVSSDPPTNEVPTTEMATDDVTLVGQPVVSVPPTAPTRSIIRRVLPIIGRGLLIVFAFVFTLTLAVLAVAAFEGAGTLDMTGFEAIVISGVALGFAIWLGIAIHRVPELVVCALAIAIVCAGAAWLRPPLRGGYGARDIHPESAASLHRSYQLAGGRLRLDLSDVVVPTANQRLTIKVGIGLAQVVVPPDTTVVLDAHMGAGQICAFGRREGGLDVSNRGTTAPAPSAETATTPTTPTTSAPVTKTLHLTTKVGTGSIVVAHTTEELLSSTCG